MKDGLSLLEVVFTVGIVALIVTGVVSLSTLGVRNAVFSRNNSLATRYTQEALEWLRGERDAGWGSFIGNIESDPTNNTFCIDSSPPSAWNNGACASTETIPSTIFLRQVIFTCYDSIDLSTTLDCGLPNVDIGEALVTVSWTDADKTHQVQSVTRLTNWRK